MTQDVTKDPAAQAILDKYTTLSAPLANRVIGTITADILSARDSPNGAERRRRAADGRRDRRRDARGDERRPTSAAPLAAFMNSGGVRGSLLSTRDQRRRAADGQVSYGEAFTVQPFGNTLVVKTCTGQQIYDVLNQQLNNPAAGLEPDHARRRRTSTTRGRARRPHVVDGSVSFDGGDDVHRQGRAATASSMNNFMADGGDGYTVFRSCTEPLGGDVDLDAFAAYLGNHQPLDAARPQPDHQGRLARTSELECLAVLGNEGGGRCGRARPRASRGSG